jgi:hypothetical protein
MAPPSTLTHRPIRDTLGETEIDPIQRQPAPASRPSDFEMIAAIRRAASVGETEAEATLSVLRRAIAKAEVNGCYRMTRPDMRHHTTMDRLIPARTKATPGSDRAIVERGLGVTLKHTSTETRECVMVHQVIVGDTVA